MSSSPTFSPNSLPNSTKFLNPFTSDAEPKLTSPSSAIFCSTKRFTASLYASTLSFGTNTIMSAQSPSDDTSIANLSVTHRFIASQYSQTLLFGTRTLTNADSSPNFNLRPMPDHNTKTTVIRKP